MFSEVSLVKATLAEHKYSLGNELGAGSFSTVYTCINAKSKQKFAVKVFSKSNLKSKEDEGHFQREIDAMAYLRYDNIVALHDFFWDKENFYLIMDYCPGGELFQFIVENKKMEEPIAALVFKQIVGAVAYCHSYGVAHRDLKPENILFTEFPHIKVGDFGLCGYISEEKLMKSFCGSPSYCSPECLCRIQYDGRLSDIWSLGVILYAMVTGEHPWDVSNTSTMLKQIMKGSYKCPSYLTTPCKDLISKMLKVKPKDRIPLDQILEHPWMKFSEYALEDEPPTLGLSLSRLRLQAPTTIEKLSSSSSRSSHRSDHGIICPFPDEDSDISDILSFEEPLGLLDARMPSLPNLPIKGLAPIERIGSNNSSQRRFIPMSGRQRNRPKLVTPKIQMTVIKEVE